MSQKKPNQPNEGKVKHLNPSLDPTQLKVVLPEGGQIPLDALMAELNRQEQATETSRDAEFLYIMHQREHELKIKMKKPIEFSKPILWWQDVPVVFPYTITLIQGQTGSHKSRLAELLCSTLLTDQSKLETELALRRNPDFDLTLFYVDTERNLKEQYPFALQSILRRAGHPIEAELPNFRFVSLLEFDRRARFEALKAQLNHMRQTTDSHIVIVLDVLTDCVTDFNRTDDSMALIDLMNLYINQFNVTFICVIHENPGMGGKARGHLGTEATNKASSVLQIAIEKDGSGNYTDFIKVDFRKCRNTARPAPIHLRYEKEVKGLVLADQNRVASIIDARKPKAHLKDVVEELEKLLYEGITQYKELKEKLMAHFEVSDKTLVDRLKDIEKREVPVSNSKGEPCKLIRSKQGRSYSYHLEPITEV